MYTSKEKKKGERINEKPGRTKQFQPKRVFSKIKNKNIKFLLFAKMLRTGSLDSDFMSETGAEIFVNSIDLKDILSSFFFFFNLS